MASIGLCDSTNITTLNLSLVNYIGKPCLHQHGQHDLTRPPDMTRLTRNFYTGQPRFFIGKSEGTKTMVSTENMAQWFPWPSGPSFASRSEANTQNRKTKNWAALRPCKTGNFLGYAGDLAPRGGARGAMHTISGSKSSTWLISENLKKGQRFVLPEKEKTLNFG